MKLAIGATGTWIRLGLVLGIGLTGCSSQSVPDRHPVPSIQAGAIAGSGSQFVPVVGADSGVKIQIQQVGGSPYVLAEGIFSEKQFAQLSASLASKPAADRKSALAAQVEGVFAKVRAVGGLPVKQIAELGYFRFLLPFRQDLLGALKAVDFERDILFSPVYFDQSSLAQVKAIQAPALGLTAASAPPSDLASFSGLVRIGAPAFVAAAEADINSAGQGLRVDGSLVKLGITDTGITYNHPTFLARDQKTNRIAYLKDFTREGRVYFSLNAKFEAADAGTGDAADLKINAEVILTPKLPDLPAGDKLSTVTDLPIKVSPELRAILLAPGNKARLGVLLESAFQSADGATDIIDLNGNGKLDDQFPLILVAGATPAEDVVYFDPTGTNDFRNAKPLADFNRAHDTVSVVAEKFGFALQVDQLPPSTGQTPIEVRSASIVGFDPGNHGTNVSGIAAGRKTVSNDKDDTLARGVAPEAQILLDRVCANNGGCDATDAMIDLVMNAGAEVVNMSLGGLSAFNDGYGVQEEVVNRLSALKNVLFVISAGNSGPGRQTIGSPSTARLSLSVAASASIGLIQRQYEWPGSGSLLQPADDQDFILFFSSRGPTAAGGFKPNLAAPGTELSSVELNAAPGNHAGLDVYWGTSMAAPTATGAYALLLDAAKKYNQTHAATPLTTDALTLRQVLISSAKPFDVARFDPVTGEKTSGQYTWADEGNGLLNLPAAWKLLFAVRDAAVPTAVNVPSDTENGVTRPVDLDYQVITRLRPSPSGAAYDGTRPGVPGMPAFGTGIYLDFAGTDTLEPVYIARGLPASYDDSAQVGSLVQQLETTQDEFVLKTVIYGSDQNWVKAGVLSGINCAASPTSNLKVTALGATIITKPDGTGTLNQAVDSVLNVCIDRQVIAHNLAPGDHGALIQAYRTTTDPTTGVARVAALPSFTVPVFVSVPNAVLQGSSAYEIHRSAQSFSVSRNYVTVPQGTSLVTITLEVPALKLGADGQAAPGEHCSGVELMALTGDNTTAAIASRLAARVSNCDPSDGHALTDPAKRRIVYTGPAPKAGLWNVDVFGSYNFVVSDYILRVDYLTATASVAAIEGLQPALNGSLTWTVKDASIGVQPDSAKSSFELTGLQGTVKSQVDQGGHVVVASGLGAFRKYPADATSVTITTGGSTGNDIDLAVLECDAAAQAISDPSCAVAGSSGTSTDQETVTFTPKVGKSYAARVDGYSIKDAGEFTSTETITTHAEEGTASVTGTAPIFTVAYAFSSEAQASSALLASPLFSTSGYSVVGALTLRDAQSVVLQSVPVRISAK